MPFQSVRTISLPPVTANLINDRRFVNVVAGTATVDESTAAGDAIGVSMTESIATASDVVSIAVLDGAIMEVESGAAVAIGARLISDATGRAITATGATARVLGKALSVASAAGEVITIVGLKDAGEFVA